MRHILVRSLEPKPFILEVEGQNVDVLFKEVLEVEENKLVEKKINEGKLILISKLSPKKKSKKKG